MHTISHIDYSHFEGGLVRMMDRFKTEGTLTGDFDEDEFIRQNPNAALLGLLYDQRVRAEYAFTGAKRLLDRLGHLDMKKIADLSLAGGFSQVKKIAAMDPEQFRDTFAEQPAVHRFTNKMAETTQKLAQVLVDEYDGDAARLWDDGAGFAEIKKRARKLPGFGEQKSAKLKYVLHYFGFRDFSNDPAL